ncbi:MAG: NifB/NifX family molybdenum-iron cluster-binding protein [Candidatus Krumholzibacteriia bacterium]
MKIAFTTAGKNLSAPLDSRFGRAARFLIYDLDEDTFEVVDNGQNLAAAQGAGIQAAQLVAQQGVAALVTGHCGPKAYQVLSAAGVHVYTTGAPTVAAALAAFRAGTLEPAAAADVPGHWQ